MNEDSLDTQSIKNEDEAKLKIESTKNIHTNTDKDNSENDSNKIEITGKTTEPKITNQKTSEYEHNEYKPISEINIKSEDEHNKNENKSVASNFNNTLQNNTFAPDTEIIHDVINKNSDLEDIYAKPGQDLDTQYLENLGKSNEISNQSQHIDPNADSKNFEAILQENSESSVVFNKSPVINKETQDTKTSEDTGDGLNSSVLDAPKETPSIETEIKEIGIVNDHKNTQAVNSLEDTASKDITKNVDTSTEKTFEPEKDISEKFEKESTTFSPEPDNNKSVGIENGIAIDIENNKKVDITNAGITSDFGKVEKENKDQDTVQDTEKTKTSESKADVKSPSMLAQAGNIIRAGLFSGESKENTLESKKISEVVTGEDLVSEKEKLENIEMITDIVEEFEYLVEKSQQLFTGIRDLPSFGGKHWMTHFQRTFSVYAKLWKHQQTHRMILENPEYYGLKRWEIGEIASKIGQLYYQYYVKTSDVNYLQESYTFYEAIRERNYFRDVLDVQNFGLIIKKMRYFARFVIVCILLSKNDEAKKLIDLLSNLVEEYSITFNPVDKSEWRLVTKDMENFIKALTSLVPVDEGGNHHSLFFPQELKSTTSSFENSKSILLEAIVIGNCYNQIKFSEITLDMYKIIHSLEQESFTSQPVSLSTKDKEIKYSEQTSNIEDKSTNSNFTSQLQQSSVARINSNIPASDPTNDLTNTQTTKDNITNASTQKPENVNNKSETHKNSSTLNINSGASTNAKTSPNKNPNDNKTLMAEDNNGASSGVEAIGINSALPTPALSSGVPAGLSSGYLTSASIKNNNNISGNSGDKEPSRETSFGIQTKDIEDKGTSPKKPNPHKHLLFRANYSTILSNLSNALREIDKRSCLLLYISSDAVMTTNELKQIGYESGVVTSSRRQYEKISTNPSRLSTKSIYNNEVAIESHCLYPADIIPFTRKPLFLIIESPNSASFKDIPRLFGQPLVCLMSPTHVPEEISYSSSVSGSLYTAFLHSSVVGFCAISKITSISNTKWEHLIADFCQLEDVVYEHLLFATIDKNLRMLLSDVFLRRFVVRHLICFVILSMHKSFTKPEDLPSSSPDLVLFDFTEAGITVVIESIIKKFGVESYYKISKVTENDSEPKIDSINQPQIDEKSNTKDFDELENKAGNAELIERKDDMGSRDPGKDNSLKEVDSTYPEATNSSQSVAKDQNGLKSTGSSANLEKARNNSLKLDFLNANNGNVLSNTGSPDISNIMMDSKAGSVSEQRANKSPVPIKETLQPMEGEKTGGSLFGSNTFIKTDSGEKGGISDIPSIKKTESSVSPKKVVEPEYSELVGVDASNDLGVLVSMKDQLGNEH
ncbi:hypothetical protein BB559_006924 [Furculomyces boomerangus]|uniref:Protein SCAI n=1 Tax=Furculomyces boomerangus TaxID=61424 RepID=A0A2T9XZT8_9FUNG|nr:hypothetical protein BB559_006924 [Furculomyces boomerangus]